MVCIPEVLLLSGHMKPCTPFTAPRGLGPPFSRGRVGGWVQPPPPPPSSGAEFLEMPKAPKKNFGLN